MHTLPHAAEAFGLSAYELKKLIAVLGPAAIMDDKRVTDAGMDIIAKHLGISAPEKKAEPAPSPAPPAGVDLMVSRRCPNPTWVLAFAADAARDSKPHEVRVPNNRVLKPGLWLKGCIPAGPNCFVWSGKVNPLIGRGA